MATLGTATASENKAGHQPRVLLSHPTGNQNVRNAVLSLTERSMLAEFWTTVAWDGESALNSLLPSRVRSQLERRSFTVAPPEKIHCVPSREVLRLALSNTPLGPAFCGGERPFSVIGMYRHFDATVARRLSSMRPDAVYAYEGGALNTFRKAKSLGITTIYELPSGYWHCENDIFNEDARRSPEFAALHPGLKDSVSHLRWKDEELALADVVLAPSNFVRRTLAGVVSEDRIRTVSYGAPHPCPRVDVPGASTALRVLYVGSLIQRKGIGYLLRALQALEPDVDLTLIGTRFAPNEVVDDACRRHKWFETLPHSEVLEIMMRSDVLVLPSLSDAFGLVVTEALSCGVPVIVTPNVGASDLVRHGVNGFIVPAGSTKDIADCLLKLSDDRKLLRAMSRNAQQTAASNPWSGYREKWADIVRSAACR
ncbi:MAG TPA: glycosyltransferase family 4 protein [candidate division Zixibacteria bacterium]|nr:glycosyltransferase family 4 protein [candidate division Zixibacteria bacterium]